MTEKTADLHIHSYYSDGTMSPEEIYKAALKNQVGILAITDHDILEGSRQLQVLCKGSDIRYISGVELDALDQGVNVHILGYGVDLNKKDFVSFVKQNRIYLDTVNSKLIERMEKDYENISLADYNDYHYDRTKGGWKALHYLFKKGLTSNLRVVCILSKISMRL
jgi:DNA polymerase III alpha subunit